MGKSWEKKGCYDNSIDVSNRICILTMNTQNKHPNAHEPLIINLGEDEEDFSDGHDDDGVEVIRPQAPHHAKRKNQHIQPAHEEEEPPAPSKTKIKKQMHELRDFGAELTELSKEQLAQLDLPDNLRDAIHEMKSIHKFGAQRRQIQYIGKLMREIDTAPIVAKLNAWKGVSQQHTAYLHRLERWRDRLLQDEHALTELLAAHPQADTQHLRALIRNAQKELEAGRPPKNFREIFQCLKDIIPEPT
jgi:ribosome-associated protein